MMSTIKHIPKIHPEAKGGIWQSGDMHKNLKNFSKENNFYIIQRSDKNIRSNNNRLGYRIRKSRTSTSSDDSMVFIENEDNVAVEVKKTMEDLLDSVENVSQVTFGEAKVAKAKSDSDLNELVIIRTEEHLEKVQNIRKQSNGSTQTEAQSGCNCGKIRYLKNLGIVSSGNGFRAKNNETQTEVKTENSDTQTIVEFKDSEMQTESVENVVDEIKINDKLEEVSRGYHNWNQNSVAFPKATDSRLTNHLRCLNLFRERTTSLFDTMRNQAKAWMLLNGFKLESSADYELMLTAIINAFTPTSLDGAMIAHLSDERLIRDLLRYNAFVKGLAINNGGLKSAVLGFKDDVVNFFCSNHNIPTSTTKV